MKKSDSEIIKMARNLELISETFWQISDMEERANHTLTSKDRWSHRLKGKGRYTDHKAAKEAKKREIIKAAQNIFSAGFPIKVSEGMIFFFREGF